MTKFPQIRLIVQYPNNLSSQSVDCEAPTNFICVCVCVCLSVCLSVCPAITACVSLTVGRILIKFGENVGTLVRLIMYEFHKNRFSVDVIMTPFLFF